MDRVIFISGIGTNIGKSYATGWLANHFIAMGKSVITIKMIQTGNVGFSEDIEIHRKLMNIPLTEDDLNYTTAPIIMSYPASPHLAAKIDNVEIDLNMIDKSISILKEKYDIILMEGAGGLMVPIREDYLTIDYLKEKNIPVCLVTNGYLGSINLTLLSLLALKDYDIKVKFVIYNNFYDDDKIIAEETLKYFNKYINQNFPAAEFLVMSK